MANRARPSPASPWNWPPRWWVSRVGSSGGSSYPWPLHSWADVRVEPNPASMGIISIQQDAEAQQRWHPLGDGYRPLPGDWVLFDGHVEVITEDSGGVLRTVGGDSLPNFSVNAHEYRAPLSAAGVVGFVNNGSLPAATSGGQRDASSSGQAGSASAGQAGSASADQTGLGFGWPGRIHVRGPGHDVFRRRRVHGGRGERAPRRTSRHPRDQRGGGTDRGDRGDGKSRTAGTRGLGEVDVCPPGARRRRHPGPGRCPHRGPAPRPRRRPRRRRTEQAAGGRRSSREGRAHRLRATGHRDGSG